MTKRPKSSPQPKPQPDVRVESDAERNRQQDLLERQAVELELQAQDLHRQVEQLAQMNADLQASEEARAAAHREAMAEMAERVRQASQFEAAMRAVPVAVAVIDRDLRYIKVNQACAAMTAHPVDAHPGRTLREINPLLSPELEAQFRRVLQTGVTVRQFPLARPTPHATGGKIDIVLDMTPFYDSDGTIAGVCSTATDVTEWLALKEGIVRVQQVEAAGQLAAGIAHDFNNLLTIVGSYCDLLLLELPETSPHREDIEDIRAAASRATTLARRMLSTAARHVVAPRPVVLGNIVLGARDILEHATRKNAQLAVECDDVCVVTADPAQVEQVLLNLVINAVDAMIGDGGTVTLRTRPVELSVPTHVQTGELTAGSYAELTVSDTGGGMDATTITRIFEPFFTTKPVGKGTGLGLSMVHSIVRAMGGGIEVTSAKGIGTTFRLLFPRVTSEEASGPRRAIAVTEASLPRGTETVLVVEDEDDLRSSVARALTRQGYRVLEARHGGEALRTIAGENGIGIVLSDLHMPGVNGYELAQRARSLGAQMPMLFMSGSSGDGPDPDHAGMVPGRDRFIQKPFDVVELLTTVREMLEPV